MTRTFPDWVYLTEKSGECWYHLSKGTRIPLKGDDVERPPARAVYAIPSRDLISLPQWINSTNPEIISQVVVAENEKLGVRTNRGPGKVSDWRPVNHNGSRTLIQSISIPWAFEVPAGKSTQLTDFLPQYALFPPPRNAVVLWTEKEEWVAGYTREDQWAHLQLLGRLMPEEVANEVALTLMELEAKRVIHSISRVIAWESDQPALKSAFESHTDLSFTFAPLPNPLPALAADWKFEPHEVSAEKIRRKKRHRALFLGFLALLFFLCLSAAATFHLWTLENENLLLTRRIQENQETAERIRATKRKWEVLSPAIDPGRSPIELFYQVAALLPEKGIRITSFEIQDHRTITFTAETSSMPAGLKLKEDLKSAEGLSDFEWNDFIPRDKGDIKEFIAIGEYQVFE